jgi:hypothetical protein
MSLAMIQIKCNSYGQLEPHTNSIVNGMKHMEEH